MRVRVSERKIRYIYIYIYTKTETMYDPAVPNNYRDVKIVQWKRAREVEENEKLSRTSMESILATPSPFDFPGMVQPPSPTPTDTSFPGSSEVLPLHLSVEELHQRRVRQSAALGITTAIRLERDELEAAHKVKVATGMDRKGRIGSKLEKFMKMATSSSSSGDAASGSNGDADVSSGMSSMGLPPSSLAGSSAPLVFQRSTLAAGGYMVKEDTNAQDGRKAPSGKPSSTILIRFIRDGPPPDLFEEDATAGGDNEGGAVGSLRAAGLAFLENVQGQCARYGIVRSVRPALLTEEQRTAVRARLEQCASTPVEVELRFARELVRVLVRFDTVAGAFKAIDALQQNCVNWSVCFFPTILFDAGTLGPSDGEPLCGT